MLLKFNVFFFQDIGDITGVSWQKTTDLQFSPEACYNNGASAVLSALTAVSAELPAILEK